MSPLEVLELHEFRLRMPDTTGAVDRIVMAWRGAEDSSVPLLTSLEDPRDVATLRARHGQGLTDADRDERAALEPFISTRQPARWYRTRVYENAQAPPMYFRMAVTESGINDDERDDLSSSRQTRPDRHTSRLALLWIGAPLETHAGLLILVGHYGDPPFALGHEIADWPLPLSRELGVRIYEGSASRVRDHGDHSGELGTRN